MKNILLVSATQLEIAPIIDHFEANAVKKGFFSYEYRDMVINTLVTGLGALRTSVGLTMLPSIKSTDLAINIGLAGSLSQEIELGSAVEVVADRFGDVGVENQDGTFTSSFDLGLDDPNMYPFKSQWLYNDDKKYNTSLQPVSGVTFNTVSGAASTIAIRYPNPAHKYIETMEGAGFAYACKCLQLQYIQIRGISNYIEPRNRAKWRIEQAVDGVNDATIAFLNSL